jgi:hypothetical protein
MEYSLLWECNLLNKEFDEKQQVENDDFNDDMFVCPYCQYFYRQFPGGMTGPMGPGQHMGPPFYPGRPGGFPGYGQQGGYPPYPGGHGGLSGYGPPSGPPPAAAPLQSQAQFGPQAVSPRAIRRCLNRYVYIWLRGGRSFWAWLNYVDRMSVSGWRWDGRRWVYFGIDIRRIAAFTCG